MLWIMIEMPSHGRNGESHVTFYQIWEKNETDAADSNVCCQYGMLICNTVCRKESLNNQVAYYRIEVNGTEVGAANSRADAAKALADARGRLSAFILMLYIWSRSIR